MKNIRTITVFLSIVSLQFFVCNTWLTIDIPSKVMDIIEIVAGILVAFGILVDTGIDPQPITKLSLLEKLKSPVAIGAIFALISYIMYQNIASGLSIAGQSISNITTLTFTTTANSSQFKSGTNIKITKRG